MFRRKSIASDATFALTVMLHMMQHHLMKLSDWLKSKKISVPAFAEQIGRHKTTVYRLSKGAGDPDPETVRLIVEATDGAVTPNDLFGVEQGAV